MIKLRSNHRRVHARKTGLFLLAMTLAAGSALRAGPEDATKETNVIQQPPAEDKFFVEVGAAGEFDYHATKFISNGSANFGAVGLYGLPAQIQSRDFSSTHDVATVDGRLRLGYIINPILTVYTMFSYSHAGGNDSRALGTVTDPSGAFGPAGGRYGLYGDVGQYQSYSGSLGGRVTLPRTILDFIHAPKFIIPYVNFSAGAKYLDSQHVRFYSEGIDAVDTTIDLYGKSWVFTGEGGLGYELKVARNFSVNVDSNYGYDSKPDNSGRILSGATPIGYSGIDKGGDRFYSSVGLTAAFKF
jgi:hypothetical protein